MKRNSTLSFVASILLVAATVSTTIAAPVIRSAAGANPAAIQATVDAFRADLGGVNNGVGNSFPTGRREINWDGVPDNFASPNILPVDFFNVNSPRGVVFNTIFAGTENFRVSAATGNPTGTAVRFGDLDPSYPGQFQTFSAQRLFGVVGSAGGDNALVEITFFVPGTKTPATVSGFGLVYTDVDFNDSGFICFGPDGQRIGLAQPIPAPNGLSFVGMTFDAGERISRVIIFSGDLALSAGHVDTLPNTDVIAMDDFIYGEPRASQFHSGDFDGDGVTDPAVFRPSSAIWYVLNSGSATIASIPFGLTGDIPVDGDFDGDQRADFCVFRPSLGQWWILRSSDGTALGVSFGQAGDRPTAGDYDKDGKTDIAFWRPSDGQYYVLRSSANFSSFYAFPFGANGDIPVQGAAQ